MIGLDYFLLETLNSTLQYSNRVNWAVNTISTNPLTKSLPLIVLVWAFWFSERDGAYPYRPQVLACLTVSIVAILAGRVLAVTLPFRLRPLHDPDVTIMLADHISRNKLDGWSSLPSDHAVFFAALCVCIFMMSKRAGILIGIYSFCIVLVPRVTFGIHWPSDILTGILVGLAVAVLIFPFVARIAVERDWSGWLTHHEMIFYPAMFVLTFQMATMFDSAREMVRLAARFGSFLIERTL